MVDSREADDRIARRAGFWLAIVNLICSPVIHWAWQKKFVFTPVMHASFYAIGASSLLILFALGFGTFYGRSRLPTWVIGVLILVCEGTIFWQSAQMTYDLALQGAHLETFVGFKIVGLSLAVLGLRPIWLGYTAVLAAGIVPAIVYFAFPVAIVRLLPIEEPAATLVASFTALVLYQLRLRSIRLEMELAHARAQEAALGQLAIGVLAIRDLSNSPIQQLLATNSLLEDGKIEPHQVAQMNATALEKLVEFARLMETYEGNVDWKRYESFDARRTLAEVLGARVRTQSRR